jgi:hypothetical protein
MDLAAVVHNMEDAPLSPLIVLLDPAVLRGSTKSFVQKLLVLKRGGGIPEIAVTGQLAMETLREVDGAAEATPKPHPAPALGRRSSLQIAHRAIPVIRRSLPGAEE